MSHRTDQPTPEPTPVPEDLKASVPDLLARAATDYEASKDVRYTMAQQGAWR